MKDSELSLFIIDCSSPCGTYFQPYCKEVLVFAENEAQALEMVKNDPDVQLVKGCYPEIVGQFEVKQGIAYVDYDRDYYS